MAVSARSPRPRRPDFSLSGGGGELGSERERAIIAAFVSVAAALAEDYDIVDLHTALTTTCVSLLDIEWAGLLLANGEGILRPAAASAESVFALEVFQLQCEQGPCLDCFHSGEVVSVPDLKMAGDRWPLFAPAAADAGFASVHAVPMRIDSTVLGALGLFGSAAGTMDADDLVLAQSLANVAGVALVAARTARDSRVLNAQLQNALDSRVTIEQAKGFLAQYAALDVHRSFEMLRRFARDHNLRLTDVALRLLDRDLPADAILTYSRDKPLPGDQRRQGRTASD